MIHSNEGIVTATLCLFRRVKMRKKISLTEFKVVLIGMKGVNFYDK